MPAPCMYIPVPLWLCLPAYLPWVMDLLLLLLYTTPFFPYMYIPAYAYLPCVLFFHATACFYPCTSYTTCLPHTIQLPGSPSGIVPLPFSSATCPSFMYHTLPCLPLPALYIYLRFFSVCSLPFYHTAMCLSTCILLLPPYILCMVLVFMQDIYTHTYLGFSLRRFLQRPPYTYYLLFACGRT